MKRSFFILSLLLPALVCAQSVPYTKFTLDNGMTFILHEDHSVPKVAVNTWFHVGSKDEPEHRSGFAHLFEHLMFMGTKRVPQGQFDKIMEAEGGDNNASTAQDRTNFYDIGPSNELPTLLWLEADRLEDLGKAMTKQKVDLQRQVVLNERREWENSPYGNSEIKMPELLYPVGHPYHFDTIGLPEDLNAATVDDVKKFFATYYVPNNATMVIAGDFDSSKVRALVAKLFGTLPRENDPEHRTAGPVANPSMALAAEVVGSSRGGSGVGGVRGGEADSQSTEPLSSAGQTEIPHPQPLPPLPAQDIRQKGEGAQTAQGEGAQTTRVTYVDQVQFPRITMAWHSPAAFAPGDAEMDLAADVLTNGISSRLYQKLIYQDKIATDVSAAQDSEKLGSIFEVAVTAKAGVPLNQIEKETREVLIDFVQHGPTKEELDRQVAQIEYAQLEKLQSIEEIADDLNRYDYYYGEPDSFQRDLDRYRNATPDSVRDAAADVIGHEPSVIMTVVPQQTPPKANPRDTRPKDEPQKSWSPASPTTFTLANGIKVFYWHRPALPLMTLVTMFNLGSEVDPAGKGGTDDLTAEMLDQGAGEMSATEFSNALDKIGASFSANTSVEDTTVSISSIEDKFPQALALYADAVVAPNFDPKEWERIKRLHLEGIQEALDDPTTVGRRMAAIEYFGASHPYGHPVGGTTKSVDAVTLDDVRAMHEEIYQPGNAVIFAAGSMAPDQFQNQVQSALGGWKQTRVNIRSEKPIYHEPTRKPLRVYIVDKPGAVQTDVRFILPAPTAHDPRYLKLEAIGTILGGTFTSRLNENLRENKGYTYGAGASYALEPSTGYFVSSAAVRTNVTGASLREFLKEFASIRSGNISQEEVQKATQAMRTGRIDTASSLAGTVGTAAGMYLEGRSYTDLGKELQQLAAMKAADLNAIVKSAIPLENGVLVLVGDKAQILAQYKGLGLPAPVVVSAQ